MKTKKVNNQKIGKIINNFHRLNMPLKEVQCTSLFNIVKMNNEDRTK